MGRKPAFLSILHLCVHSGNTYLALHETVVNGYESGFNYISLGHTHLIFSFTDEAFVGKYIYVYCHIKILKIFKDSNFIFKL